MLVCVVVLETSTHVTKPYLALLAGLPQVFVLPAFEVNMPDGTGVSESARASDRVARMTKAELVSQVQAVPLFTRFLL
jgi:hypothetical protein